MSQDSTQPRSLVSRSGPALASLGIAAGYFALRASAQTADALAYAAAIRDGEPLLVPHHIGFQPILRAFRMLLARTGLELDAITVAQLHGSLWAGVAVVAFFRLLRSTRVPVSSASIGAMALAISVGFWRYATQGEAYVPSLACLLLATATCCGRDDAGRTRTRDVKTALLWVLAICYHQSATLFAMPLAALVTGRVAGSQAARRWIFITALAGLVTIGVYVVGMLAVGVELTTGNFVSFCLNYAQRSFAGWGDVDNVSLKGLRFLMFGQARSVFALEEGTIGRFSIWSYALAAFAAAGAASVVVQALRAHRRLDADARRLAWAFALWLGAVYTFALWWMPSEDEYTIQTLAPLFGGAAIALARRPAGRFTHGIAAGCLVAVAAWNLCTSVLPARDPATASSRRAATAFAAGDQNALYLVDHITRMHLLYYWRVPLSGSALVFENFLALYRDDPPESCAAIDRLGSWIVAVDRVHPNYIVRGFGADQAPEGWRRVLRWVFDVRDADGADTTANHAAIELLPESDGRGLLRIDPSRRVSGGLPELGRTLDELLDSSDFQRRLR